MCQRCERTQKREPFVFDPGLEVNAQQQVLWSTKYPAPRFHTKSVLDSRRAPNHLTSGTIDVPFPIFAPPGTTLSPLDWFSFVLGEMSRPLGVRVGPWGQGGALGSGWGLGVRVGPWGQGGALGSEWGLGVRVGPCGQGGALGSGQGAWSPLLGHLRNTECVEPEPGCCSQLCRDTDVVLLVLPLQIARN